MINLKCQNCGVDYQKPAMFVEFNKKQTDVFFRWSLTFCDKCRQEKTKESFKHLPEILKTLSEDI